MNEWEHMSLQMILMIMTGTVATTVKENHQHRVTNSQWARPRLQLPDAVDVIVHICEERGARCSEGLRGRRDRYYPRR